MLSSDASNLLNELKKWSPGLIMPNSIISIGDRLGVLNRGNLKIILDELLNEECIEEIPNGIRVTAKGMNS